MHWQRSQPWRAVTRTAKRVIVQRSNGTLSLSTAMRFRSSKRGRASCWSGVPRARDPTDDLGDSMKFKRYALFVFIIFLFLLTSHRLLSISAAITTVSNMQDDSFCDIDWDKMQLRPFDDGHVPENLKDVATQIADHPFFHRGAAQVHMYANALPESLVDAAYEKTANSGLPAWGDYVTFEQIKSFWNRHDGESIPATNPELTIALAAYYLKLSLGATGNCQPSKSFSLLDQPKPSPLWTDNDVEELAHGVAVWGLAAGPGAQVPYHLDYAEQVRYESNVIVPPILAGTLQCTRDNITGGDFLVSLEGIPHYQKHGYKCKRKQPRTEELLRIPYQYNQLTCHRGDLPHASTRIERIDGEQLRVIVGFNVFGHDVGKFVRQWPEHSENFRRKVKVQRALLHGNSKIMSLERLRQNKPLSKMLVLAKRERIKKEFKQAQEMLAKQIPNHLPATVQDLMDCFYSENQTLCWPASPTDIHVYLHHQIKEGKFKVLHSVGADELGRLVSPRAVIALADASDHT